MKDFTAGRKKTLAALADFIATEDEIYGLPVDIVEIAKDNGITYSVNDYDEYFDGMLEHENGNFHIFINNHGELNMNTPSYDSLLRMSLVTILLTSIGQCWRLEHLYIVHLSIRCIRNKL